jgi:xanthine dehydrogenase YagT iron-sulfur-binding subunit
LLIQNRQPEARMTQKSSPPKLGISRRSFLGTTGAVSATLGLAGQAKAQEAPEAHVPADARPQIKLTVNGARRTLTVEPRTTLVEALRDTLGLTGTKIGCNQGQCGACTVLLNGVRANSCLTLAVMADGGEVVTVEGLADPGGALHPMQAAFAENDAFQCGYCTPGQILSAIGCVEEGHAGSEAEIREYMSGNLCRCGAYPNIVAAVMQAAAEMEA